MVKLLLTLTFTLTTFFLHSTTAKTTTKQKPPIQYAEPRLQAAIKRSLAVQANFSLLYDRSYDRFPGFFEEVIPQVETYHQEVDALKKAYAAWTANNSAPMENLLWHLPGMVFDLEEHGEQVLPNSFVATATSRITAQEKSIRQEMSRINKLIEAETTKPSPSFPLAELLNRTSVSLKLPLQGAIVKLNFTTARPPAENVTDEAFVEAIFAVAGLEEQLSGLLELQIKVTRFWNSLVRHSKKVATELGVAELSALSQRYRYLELVVGKAVQRAVRTFKKVVKSGDAMAAFEEFARGRRLGQ